MKIKEKLIATDSRFSDIIEALDVKEVCMECGYFNKNQAQYYRCAIIGNCIGVTLSDRVNEYLIGKL